VLRVVNRALETNQTIQQLDLIVQQKALSSENMTAMAKNLSGQAEDLQEAITSFRIHEIRQQSGSPPKKVYVENRCYRNYPKDSPKIVKLRRIE
jgi:hypothetical protein